MLTVVNGVIRRGGLNILLYTALHLPESLLYDLY